MVDFASFSLPRLRSDKLELKEKKREQITLSSVVLKIDFSRYLFIDNQHINWKRKDTQNVSHMSLLVDCSVEWITRFTKNNDDDDDDQRIRIVICIIIHAWSNPDREINQQSSRIWSSRFLLHTNHLTHLETYTSLILLFEISNDSIHRHSLSFGNIDLILLCWFIKVFVSKRCQFEDEPKRKWPEQSFVEV